MRQSMIALIIVPLFLACSQATMTPPPTTTSADASAQVRQAELDFAKAFKDRDEPRFISMLGEGATFLGPQRTLHGKTEVMSVWSNLIRDNQFSWEPERVEVNQAGNVGLSTGPVRDASGTVIGQFSSVWQRQPDASWKVIFDGPGCFCPPPPATAAARTGNQYVYVLRPARIEMLTAGPTEREMQVLQDHVAYMKKLTSDQVLLLAGRTQNNDANTLGLAIFQAPSESAAREIMNNDPAVRNGVMTATLFPYDIAFGTFAPQ